MQIPAGCCNATAIAPATCFRALGTRCLQIMFHDSDTPRFQRTQNIHLAMSRIREVAKYLGLSVSVALVSRQHPSDILSHRVQEKTLLVTPAQKVAYSGLTWAIYLRHLRIDGEMGLFRVVTYLPLFPSNCCRIIEKNTYFQKVANSCRNSGTIPFKNSIVAKQMILVKCYRRILRQSRGLTEYLR